MGPNIQITFILMGNNQQGLLIPWRRKAEFQQNMFIKSVEKETVKGLENTLQNRTKIPKDNNRLERYTYLEDQLSRRW